MTANPNEMVVTYTVFHKTDKSHVKYKRIDGTEYEAEAKVTTFEDEDKYKAYIHRAVLIGLEPDQTYGQSIAPL